MFKKIIKLIVVFLTGLIIITGLYFSYNWITGNFHTVSAKQAYRSKQLSKKQLEHYIKKYDIKSVLNLRGAEPGIKWYEDETAIGKAYGVEYYDVGISAMVLPEDKNMSEIINILKSAPRPILIHCLGGADRTGLVSAIWKIVIDKESKEEASKQLSVFYGHMPFGKARAMDRWLATHNINSDTDEITKF